MNLTTHKLLAAMGLSLAAIFAFAPRSAAVGAGQVSAASPPPKPGLQMHWFQSHASPRRLQSRLTRFGSRAVIGLESMHYLASVRRTYRLEHVRTLPALQAVEVSFDSSDLPERLWSAGNDPRIRYVSPVLPLRHTLNLPSDPLLQTVDPVTALPFEWQFAKANLEHALELTPGDARIKVGVIDTGVDVVPDLAGKIDGLYDVVLDDTQPSPSAAGNDDYGHGTAVASLIAAGAGDGFGMAGFGGAAHIVGVHAGTLGGFTDTDVAVGLAKLDELGVRIVNLSLGGEYQSSPILVDAIHKAAADGMLIVAAAGNEANGHISWPAADLQPGGGGRSYGLAVGATNQDGSRASFSNTGRHLSLVAPGNFAGDCSGVLVAVPKTNLLSDDCYPEWAGPGGATYSYVAGTSFSSPEVAGVAALVWAARPELKNYQVADIIKQSASGNSSGGWTPTMGCGHLDAAAAVELALSRSPAQWERSAKAVAHPCSVDATDAPDWPAEKSQTILFGSIPDRTTADGDFEVRATASSGLPVTFTAEQSCTIRHHVVHLKGAGVCVVTAAQPGDDNFNAAPAVTQLFMVTEAIVPKALPASGKAGGTVRLRYSVEGSSTVKTTVVVKKNGTTTARIVRRGTVESGASYKVAWHAPKTARGNFRFCVTLHDRSPARSFTSCAPIRLVGGGPVSRPR